MLNCLNINSSDFYPNPFRKSIQRYGPLAVSSPSSLLLSADPFSTRLVPVKSCRSWRCCALSQPHGHVLSWHHPGRLVHICSVYVNCGVDHSQGCIVLHIVCVLVIWFIYIYIYNYIYRYRYRYILYVYIVFFFIARNAVPVYGVRMAAAKHTQRINYFFLGCSNLHCSRS